MLAMGAVNVPVKNKFVPKDPPAEKFKIVPTVKVDMFAAAMLPYTALRLPALTIPVAKIDAILPTVLVKLFAVTVAEMT